MEFYGLCVVRKVGALLILSNVINEIGNFSLNLKTVKLHGNAVI